MLKKERLYNELQGKPSNLSKEEKEKERKKNHNNNVNHKLDDAIIRKKGKDKELEEKNEKIKKEHDRIQSELEKLTCDINELLIKNEELKNEINDLRRRKEDSIKQRDALKEDNYNKELEINDLITQNTESESKIKKSELKREIENGIEEVKEFEWKRNELEKEYHKIIEESIKRERETKKEQAKKRQMQKAVSTSKNVFKGNNAKEVEKQRKAIIDDEIMDRTPVLDVQIEKWCEINKMKKCILNKHGKNSKIIEDTFMFITNYMGLDSFEDLPVLYMKAEDQMSRINFDIQKLDLEIDKLESEKEILEKKISFLTDKKTDNYEEKTNFINSKENEIKAISEAIEKLEKDIKHKRKLFAGLQTETDKYLEKLNGTYLADYVPNKMNVDQNIKYTEQTVNKFISNVEDYYKLIQEFDEWVEGPKRWEEADELELLRREIREKLENFEKNKVLNKNLFSSMKSEVRNGTKIKDIIQHTSSLLLDHLESSNSLNVSKKRNNNSKDTGNQSQLPTTDDHHFNESTIGNSQHQQQQQQSSIFMPNSSVEVGGNNTEENNANNSGVNNSNIVNNSISNDGNAEENKNKETLVAEAA